MQYTKHLKGLKGAQKNSRNKTKGCNCYIVFQTKIQHNLRTTSLHSKYFQSLFKNLHPIIMIYYYTFFKDLFKNTEFKK